ncbi:MAG TPA: HNH endonuclease signature motif containing protein [Polyangiaceae bacterium]|nr:HNH endonuclease signature motif containing protein [Polyangiaceae bacterium]
MQMHTRLESLKDQVLLSQFADLVRQDREGNANLLRHIDTIDRRRLWARLGHPSLFDFLVTRYHMSESTAGKRIGAARAARSLPVLFGMVARGEIHLSGIHRLKAHLTSENHAAVLAAAKHKTMRQIDELVARLAPQPDVPSTLRALPTRTTATALTAAGPGPGPALLPASSAPPTPSASAPPPAPPALPTASTSAPPMAQRRSPDPAPLSPGRYRLQVTISADARSTLKQLQDLLAHQIPNGDPAAIVERALAVLLTQVHKRKTGITAKPRAHKPAASTAPQRDRTTPPTETRTETETATATATATITARRTRHIEVALRRDVWPREGGRCGFVGEDGRRCNETRGLEFAHRQPWAKGGAHSATNLGLRCRAHNALEADRDYGAGFMASKRKRKPWNVRESLARYSVGRVPSAP